jgi:hypothetical protein
MVPISLFFPKVELGLEIFLVNFKCTKMNEAHIYLWLAIAPGFDFSMVDAVVREVVYAANADTKSNIELRMQ